MTIPVLDSTKDLINTLPFRQGVFGARAIEDLHWLTQDIHARNRKWWVDLETGAPIDRNVGEMIALCHSELSEALEGRRKGLQDDKLPEFSMLTVELADTIIRVLDLAGGLKLPLAEALWRKLHYNETRADHTREARLREGGKKY